MVMGRRTAASFIVRDATWTDSEDVTHRLLTTRRTACNLSTGQDLRGLTPWKQPSCVVCIAHTEEETGWAVLQEAALEP